MLSNVFKAQRVAYYDVHVCYGTSVEHTSLLNRSGVCDGIVCWNIVSSYTAFSSIETAFNLVKIQLLFRSMLLIQ